MKRKSILPRLCFAGTLILCLSACGAKTDTNKEETGSAAVGSELDETNESTQNAVQEAAADIDARPETEDDIDYTGIQDINVGEYVTLGDYKNMTVEVRKDEVTDDDIESIINSRLMKITKGEVKDGDIVNIDFVGKKDGEAFSGGTAEDYELEIGSGTFIPGFEEGLIGVEAGDTVDLKLTFPDDYGNTEYAGADVVFTVTVNSIAVNGDYESLTDEEIVSLGMPYGSKKELWDEGARIANEDAQTAYEASIRSAALNKLVEESTIVSVPEYLVDEEMESYIGYMNDICQSVYETDLETYVSVYYGITMDEYEKEIKEMSQEAVRANLVYEAFARAEGIQPSEEQITGRADAEAADYGYATGRELIGDVGYNTFRMYVVQELVEDRLREIVTVTDNETESESETAN